MKSVRKDINYIFYDLFIESVISRSDDMLIAKYFSITRTPISISITSTRIKYSKP